MLRREGEARFRGMAESLAMEVIANNLFNDRSSHAAAFGQAVNHPHPMIG